MTVACDLRRRRSAARRCTVMADGRRDPMDKPQPKVPTTVRILGRTTEFDGPGVYSAIKAIGCRSMRARHGGGWWVPADAGDDVLALLEVRGYSVQVTF